MGHQLEFSCRPARLADARTTSLLGRWQGKPCALVVPLDFSRHSVSSTDFKKTDLNQLLAETLGEMEVLIEKNQATINYNTLPVVSVVPGLMQQLFSNIISNAFKFRKKTESPVIDIKSKVLTGDDLDSLKVKLNGSVYHKITIADNGIGFENEHSQEIFKVFKRLHNYQEFEGSGVGLSICKKIIEKHGGTISAAGAVDQGSVFTLIIPETQPKNH